SSCHISHVMSLVGQDQQAVETELSQMILNKVFYRVIDQGRGCLLVFNKLEGKGKKKHSSVAAELMPPPAHMIPSASCPTTPAPPVSSSLVTGALSPRVSIFAPYAGHRPWEAFTASWLNSPDSSTDFVWRITILNDSLTSMAVGYIFTAQEHTMPFNDSLSCPPLTHGTANSAAPALSLPAHGPPSEATAYLPLAPKPASPPRPAQSAKHLPSC
ncbi:putative 26S proteasome regulatory subunit rpn6, partial [Leucoagaricus sp. SymC.cos]